MVFHLVLLIFAMVLFGVASLQLGTPMCNRFVAGGLMALTASMINW